MEWLTILYQYHTEWIAIVKSFGEHKYAEDIVMETYLRLHQSKSNTKVVNNGKVNRAFMWVALKNNYVSYATMKSKVHKVNIKDYKLKSNDLDLSSQYKAIDVLDKKIETEINTWHWYDRELFVLITKGEISMRKFSRDSKISLSSISNTMSKCKKKLRLILGEDYEDYINQDFNKILNDT